MSYYYISYKDIHDTKDVVEMLRVHGRDVGRGGGRKYFCITVFQHVQSDVSLSLIIIKWVFFLSLKITSTFDAPGVCVDIKIQVINVHVYIVARRFEHDKYR